eukprot:c23101_g1_i4 orf=640-1107(+)
MDLTLHDNVVQELMWTWDALRNSTCCQAVVVVFRCRCLLQAGLAAESPNDEGEPLAVDPFKLVEGSLCQMVWASRKQSYFANLSLYPGRVELMFLPPNTQAVILQPLGDEGIMIVAGDTIRGFGSTDQVWIASIGEKLDTTLGKCILTNNAANIL